MTCIFLHWIWWNWQSADLGPKFKKNQQLTLPLFCKLAVILQESSSSHKQRPMWQISEVPNWPSNLNYQAKPYQFFIHPNNLSSSWYSHSFSKASLKMTSRTSPSCFLQTLTKLQNHRQINYCCFKQLHFWEVYCAAINNQNSNQENKQYLQCLTVIVENFSSLLLQYL